MWAASRVAMPGPPSVFPVARPCEVPKQAKNDRSFIKTVILTHTHHLPIGLLCISVFQCGETSSTHPVSRVATNPRLLSERHCINPFLGRVWRTEGHGWRPGLSGLVAVDTGFRESPSVGFEEPSCFVHSWSPAGVGAGGRDFAQLLDLGLWRSNWIPRPGHAGVLGEGHCPVITSRPAPQTRRFPSTLPPGLGRFPGRPFQYRSLLNAGAVAAIPEQMPTPGGQCPSWGCGVRGGSALGEMLRCAVSPSSTLPAVLRICCYYCYYSFSVLTSLFSPFLSLSFTPTTFLSLLSNSSQSPL